MLIDKPQNFLLGPVTGKFGISNGYGRARLGFNGLGYLNPYHGIYTIKVTRNGRKISQMPFYFPTNPQTVPQQAWRDVFKAAVLAWRALTVPEQQRYNERAAPQKITGYNLLIKEYLASHRI